ncbi:MAG: formylglycine-generating enzyme family protein [Nitrospirae bacterium]|nr:formylglycine-generating enzyme family protein [Nitrospirota bacterium]
MPKWMVVFIILFFVWVVLYSVKEVREQNQQLRSAGMVVIQGGCYEMGDHFGKGGEDERPVHAVCVDPFYLGKYEVTTGEFRQFAQETGYQTEAERSDGCEIRAGGDFMRDRKKNWRNPGFAQTERDPVVCVSWNDASQYIGWMKKKSPKKAMEYRLPTEAEWEFAARERGKLIQYPGLNEMPSENTADESFKRTFPDMKIWIGYNDGYVFTSPAGSFRPAEQGLYDIDGNVNEWIQDRYGEDVYKEGPKTNPAGPSTGRFRVIRGGSWADEPVKIRLSARQKKEPGYRSNTVGFRLALPLTER